MFVSWSRKPPLALPMFGAALAALALTVAPTALAQSPPATPVALPADLFSEGASDASRDAQAGEQDALRDSLKVPPASDAELESLAQAIDTILRSPTVRGHVIGARVVALSSGQVVYERNASELYKPASNTKVFSTAAAFGLLGPNWRTESRIVVNAPPVDGVVRGDLMLHGLFDMSWSTLFYPNANYVANRLIDQLEERGVKEVRGDIHIRGVFVYDGHRFGTLNTHSERLQVANAFQARLRARGIRHGGNMQVSPNAPDRGFTTELASWRGPSLPTIAAHINRLSHNEFADTLMLAIGRHVRDSATYGDGFQAAKAWFETQGIDTKGMELHDGSGLSHNNRVNATQLTELVAAVQRQPWADLWNSTLSVAGHDGTYGQRCRSEFTLGAAWLKSGTINEVITTGGMLHHRGTGEVYSLALLMNQVVHQPSARLALDQAVEAIGVWRKDARRPRAIVLEQAQVRDNEEVELRWTRAAQADFYVIEGRDAESAWRPLAKVDGTRTTLPRRSQIHSYRVRAVNASGVSDPSGVLIAGGPRTAPKVTVVEGNDRWASPQHENGLKTQPWFLTEFMRPLNGYRVSSVNNDALSAVKPSEELTVVFALGEESRGTDALSTSERDFIRAQIRAGGRVIAAGSEIGWDVGTNSPDGPVLLDEVFGASFLADNAQNTAACGSSEAGPVCAHFWTPGMMRVDMPDSFTPTRGETCMAYAGMSSAACVSYKGAAIVGFPLESVDNDEDRIRLFRMLFQRVGTPQTDDRT